MVREASAPSGPSVVGVVNVASASTAAAPAATVMATVGHDEADAGIGAIERRQNRASLGR